ncbi:MULTISPECIES: hypothetical protein [Nostocales]|uniref:Glycosyltransferase family 2 protein n=3 Tax=Nostocales TaxID=1161 RepID=A0A8S9T9R5_9CYAN|nr:hypothetical protein [Tolypothrix bouteillei]KAF3888372.1 glycosyltransferase family 2 protein [Tolypothrix bouteillei VB521301]
MHVIRLTTPVAFIIFKRPHTTEKVFEAIRQVKPYKLFIIADGPRQDRPSEAEKCEATRAIIDRVDWDCEVLKNYSEINLGCGKRVSSGLDWVFEHVEEAIILEDDCLPHPTFFRFCEELLERYRYDERIGTISGQNIQFGRKRDEYSYYFSHYNHVWGWATWKRAWKDFDLDMKKWSEIKEKGYLNNILTNTRTTYKWTKELQSTYDAMVDGLFNVWAYQWQLTCWMHNYLGIISNVNLISNIGFGSESTHTSGTRSRHANMPTEAVEFPLKHPPYMIRHLQADNFTQKTLFSYLHASLLQRFIWKMQKVLEDRYSKSLQRNLLFCCTSTDKKVELRR